MSGPDQPQPGEHEVQKSTEPLKPEELDTLRNLFVRAAQNGQYFGPFLMHTAETDVNRGGSLESLIAERVAQAQHAYSAESAKDVPLEEYLEKAREEARASVDADRRIEDLNQVIDMVSWPYTKGMRSLILELHNMKRKLPSPFKQTIETNTVHPSFHIESSYKVRGRNGEADTQLYTYKQNLHEGQDGFEDDPRLMISFKPDGTIATIAVMYKEISAGGVDNMGSITRLRNIPYVAGVLDKLQWPFKSSYAHCALTLDFRGSSVPSITYGYGNSYEEIEAKGTYTYNARTDKFELSEDKISMGRAKRQEKEDHWSIKEKEQRESFRPDANSFMQLLNEMLSLVPVS